jgi:hypothetical protein
LVSSAVPLISDSIEAIWKTTRIDLDITVDNQYQKMKLVCAKKFTCGGKYFKKIPPEKIHPEALVEIRLKADINKTQFKEALSHELVPTESAIIMPIRIYLIFCWKITATDGSKVYMTLIEHNNSPIFLKDNEIGENYYQIFCNRLQEPNTPIRCSWYLGEENIPFTISMVGLVSSAKSTIPVNGNDILLF